MNDMKLVTFEPLDSLFFRESKPFNAGEGGFLESQFPPSAQSLSGAIRGAIGDSHGVDWKNDKAKVASLVGEPGDDPKPLAFGGPYLFKKSRLYPVPLHLLYSGKEKTWACLQPSNSTFNTDCGEWKLPTPDAHAPKDAKQIENGWLDETGMQEVLKGNLPANYLTAQDIFALESRTGIGRDNTKSVVNEGQLYFVRHLRLQQGVSLGMGVSGVEQLPTGMIRLGGEGRLACMATGAMRPSLPKQEIFGSPKGLILILLTHGDFDGNPGPDWYSIYTGVKLVSACVGKPVREGGWDYANRQPKILKSLAPAGSCYFLQINSGTHAEAIEALYGKRIGQRTAFGYGEIAVGIWN